ncbi:MAG: CoA transferase, partial [Alphaproteobacteria bacterium]|nr:CoA transferase [Alphaproteobacteria bacterium]
MAPTSLDGVVILERAGSLPVAVAATLLGELGATVLRVEDPALSAADDMGWRDHPLALAGKTRIALSLDTPDGARQWRELLDRADAVICAPPLPPVDEAPPHVIQCDVSAFGRDGGDPLSNDASEAILQAIGGMMSTTGAVDGPPEFIRAPLVELFTGFNCATAILAALRVRESGGPAQRIDMSAFDCCVTLIGVFIGQVQVGEGHGLRLGASHPLVSPWNAYPTSDGWVLMCSSTEDHWERIRALIGQDTVKDDPRFVKMTARKKNHEAVDALVAAWTRGRTTAEAVAGFEAVTIPAGPVVTIPELMSGVDDAPIRTVDTGNGASVTCAGSVFALSETPAWVASSIGPPNADIDAALQTLGPKPETAAASDRRDGDLPLAGIRVVEVSIFTAGPLGGRYLADLGAEVIKIEQPGGEGGRTWTPSFGGVSGYFATYNAG